MTNEKNNTSSIISKVLSFCNTLCDDGVEYGESRITNQHSSKKSDKSVKGEAQVYY